jgi:hypothetical protein
MTEQQAIAYDKECEDMFRSDMKHLVDVVAKHYMPLTVRKFAAKEFFDMECFMLKMQPEDWQSALARLEEGLGPNWHHLIRDARAEVKRNPPPWRKYFK